MKVRNVLVGLFGAALVGGITTLPAAEDPAATSPPGSDNLRWTPHRVASMPRDPAPNQVAPAPPAATREAPAPKTSVASTAAPTTPPGPASVSLPPGVPPIGGSATPGYAPLRQSFPTRLGDWMSLNRLSGNMQTSSPDGGGMLGIDFTRAPQGERGRPILAPEAMQRRGMPRTAVAMGPAYDGGIAPPFNPGIQPGIQAARPGRERIAMNVDGIPSVMARGPQAAAIDDSATPARLPAAAQPPAAATLPSPTPSAATPAPAFELGIGASDGTTEPMMDGSYDPGLLAGGPEGQMLMGQYPAQVHVESFYDDPYAYEDCEDPCLGLCVSDGRVCAWLRRFGRPYYGWRWYRDFTASVGVTSFTNSTDLGFNGNYGVNEYLNWAMPFWNAFGVGWQVGIRGVQTDFQPATVRNAGGSLLNKGSRDQQFVTTGFFTRAFEGRGFQGGAVYDYLADSWYDEVNVSQIRSELSYVWGYHEIGYWGAQNVQEQKQIYTARRTTQFTGSTVDIYAGFYRLNFGDANEWRAWGGATGNGEGIFGSSLRAPMSRSLALEGLFTYLVPKQTRSATLADGATVTAFSPAAWNVSVNLVYYPAGRSRRSLASPYRPLFDVADNGSMIRSLVLPRP